MYKINFFLFGLVFLICSCSNNKGNDSTSTNGNTQSLIEQEKYTSDPTGNTAIPKSSFGNARVAFLTNKKITRGSQVRSPRFLGVTDNKALSTVLVHKNNTRDLILVKEYNGYKYEDVPLSAFRYQAKTLTLTLTRSVVIVEDELMEQILKLTEKDLKFYSFAKQVSKDLITNPNWPVEDTVVVEKNGEYYALQKPEKLNPQQLTPEGKAYLALKLNIMNARSTGHIAPILNIKRAKRKR
ncbi:hypothetical protein [Candidatus Uabimicrobium amorphum]|uniref:Uncharacterized protein n=1 Tax=Uabimicrobium amorphum TaxID=2596890 RepID=A0A5S9IPD1_UABAM|nr:hypothetical protein [Candidatus Uabimicrobium amorphum]BBM85633.1 hypothetical protein UABAM_04007 [Candidatus Uabimicrobium amorphum]